MPPIQVVLRFPITPAWQDRIGSKKLESFREVMRRFVVGADYPIFRPDVLWPPPGSSPPVRWQVNADFEEVIVDLDKIHEFRPVPSFPATFFADFSEFAKALFVKEGRGYAGMPFVS
jgi:hypothetical protein